MKKIFCLLMAFCMVFAFAVTGCAEHKCEFESAWTSDETNHWHKCASEDCDVTDSVGAHVWDDGVLSDGVMTYTCTVCAKTKTENKANQYKTVCENISTSVKGLNYVAPLSKGGVMASTFALDETVYVDAEERDYMQVKGVMAFVKMLAEMIDNPNFKIVSEPVKFTYSYVSPYGTETGTAILMYKFDEKNNKVVMHWNVDAVSGENSMKIFLYIDVDYNFATNTMGDFTVHSLQGDGEHNMTISYIYRNKVLKSVNQMSVDVIAFEVNAQKLILEGKAESVIDLNADFTAEYTAMMDFMNPQLKQ